MKAMKTSTFISHIPRRPYWAAGYLFPHSRRGPRKRPGVGYFFIGGSMEDKDMARLVDEMVRALNESYYFDGTHQMRVNRDLSSFDIVKHVDQQ